jgi:hypothetical protein
LSLTRRENTHIVFDIHTANRTSSSLRLGGRAPAYDPAPNSVFYRGGGGNGNPNGGGGGGGSGISARPTIRDLRFSVYRGRDLGGELDDGGVLGAARGAPFFFFFFFFFSFFFSRKTPL